MLRRLFGGNGPTVPQMSVATLRAHLDAQQPLQLLDVRSPEEFQGDGHIADARLIPLPMLALCTMVLYVLAEFEVAVVVVEVTKTNKYESPLLSPRVEASGRMVADSEPAPKMLAPRSSAAVRMVFTPREKMLFMVPYQSFAEANLRV